MFSLFLICVCVHFDFTYALAISVMGNGCVDWLISQSGGMQDPLVSILALAFFVSFRCISRLLDDVVDENFGMTELLFPPLGNRPGSRKFLGVGVENFDVSILIPWVGMKK